MNSLHFRGGDSVSCHRGLMVLGGFLASLALVASTVAVGSTAAFASPRQAPPFINTENDPFGTTWSYNPYNPDYLPQITDLTLLPLAVQTTKGFDTFTPELASSWKIGKTTVTVRLRPGVKWQNGAPVTAKDVMDTAYLTGYNGGLWQDITGIRAVNNSTVSFAVRSGISPDIAAAQILGMAVVPSSTYGPLVQAKDLGKQLNTYYTLEATNPTAAAASPAGKMVSAMDGRLVKFSPKTIIGDGPFKLTTVRLGEEKFVKSPTFFAASKVHIPVMLYEQAGSAETNFSAMLGGAADFTYTGGSWLFWTKALKTPDLHGVEAPNLSQFAIYFNNRKYPLNNVKVRQAISYIIHRPDMLKLQDGGGSWHTYVKHPSLLYGPYELHYVSRAQLDSLNTYPYDPAKATKLLESAGFHKTGGRWMMPDGKPFTLTADSPAGWVGEVQLMKVVAGWLTQFGIPTSSSAVEQPGYWTYLDDGNFDLDWGWGSGPIDPLVGFQQAIGSTGYNLIKSSEPGFGFGPDVNVPGLGKVNVPDTIVQEASTIGPGKKMDQLVWDWARLVNSQVPILPYGNKRTPMVYSTRRYVDWPKASSPLWQLMGYNIHEGILAFVENGYIRPKG